MSDNLKERLKDAVMEGETHKELENLASEALSTLDARDAEIKRLREALEDTIRSPKGVVPDSAALIRQPEKRSGST